jgi:hypothetical protein
MPASLEAITAEPPHVTWSVGRRGPLPLSILRLCDYAAVNAHVKALPLDAVKFALRDAPPDQVRFMLIAAYQEVARSLHDLEQDNFLTAMRTVPGRAFALWRSLRRLTPDVGLGEVEDSLSMANWEEAGRILDLVSGFPPPPKKAEAPAAATAPSTGAESSAGSPSATGGPVPASSGN